MAVSGGSAQTRRERPNSAEALKICNSHGDDVSMRDPHCSGRTSILVLKAFVFLSWIESVGWVW